MWIVESQNERGEWFLCGQYESRADAWEAVRIIRVDGFTARARKV